jgi:hypothetical protein
MHGKLLLGTTRLTAFTTSRWDQIENAKGKKWLSGLFGRIPIEIDLSILFKFGLILLGKNKIVGLDFDRKTKSILLELADQADRYH